MVSKVFAILAVLLLPLNIALWHRSYSAPVRYRCDLTLFKSLTVYLRDGVMAVHILTMPTKTAARSEFQASLKYDPAPGKGGLHLSSIKKGDLVHTWLVFPFWLSSALLTVISVQPVFAGPLRQLWRHWRGHCQSCGYNLTGNRTGRCPECGEYIKQKRWAKSTRPVKM